MKTGQIYDVRVEWEGDFACYLWAAPGKKKIIEKIDGVFSVFAEKTRYHVYLDHRFSKKEVWLQIIKELANDTEI